MNPFAIVILAALLLNHLLGVLADWLNLRALRSELPAEFDGVYDADAYRTSQAYTRERTRFGLLSGSVGLAALLAFWGFGGFPALDAAVRALGFGEIPTGLLFIGALLLLQTALSLPFSLYSTFVIEERYGFNRTTPGVFAADMAKSFALSLLLGAPLLAGVLWFFQAAGPLAWLYVWGMVTAVSLALQYVAPVWILPLFNRFTPLPDPELKERVLAYAARVGFPVRDVLMMDGSKRSTKSNAFFTGFGRNKRIALFDTLLERHSGDEILAVVAHEVGHSKLRHIQTGMLTGVLHTGALLFVLSLFLGQPGLFEAFGMREMSVHAGLVFFGLLYSPVELALSVALNALSRRHEFQADAYAARTTGNPGAMIDALKKLSRDNLSNLTPHPLQVWLHFSHPPVLERIRALRQEHGAHGAHGS